MTENLHQTLPAILKQLFHNPPTSHVVLAPECGGSHRIQLFASGVKSRATNYCWPDVAIIQNGEVRVILEIEQAGIVSPGRIGSKLVPVTLSTYLRNEEIGCHPVPISRETTFIQVVNTASLQPATRKLLQYQNLEAGIRNILPLGCIVRYFLIPVVAEDAPPFGTAKYNVVLDAINDSPGAPLLTLFEKWPAMLSPQGAVSVFRRPPFGCRSGQAFSKPRSGTPGSVDSLLKSRTKSKNKVKGSGQECPLYTTKSIVHPSQTATSARGLNNLCPNLRR